MNIIWLGHASFRIEIEDAVLLVDPWIDTSPVFPADRRAEALAGATHILLTHAHGDHATEAAALAAELGAPVACIYDLAQLLDGVEAIGFNKGGTVDLGGAQVTMVNAQHSSTFSANGAGVPAGSEAGFMIAGEGHVIYLSGDTGIMADMGWMGEYFRPDIGILSAGGHFTMDMKAAAWAAKRFFDFKLVIPCHYRTFPLLEQSAEALVAGLPGVDVRAPDIMETVTV